MGYVVRSKSGLIFESTVIEKKRVCHECKKER